jgi:hypothetical protein
MPCSTCGSMAPQIPCNATSMIDYDSQLFLPP